MPLSNEKKFFVAQTLTSWLNADPEGALNALMALLTDEQQDTMVSALKSKVLSEYTARKTDADKVIATVNKL